MSANTVYKYRQELGLRAVLAVQSPYTSKGNKEHPVHSYKLKGIEIIRANQVWSTDITYIRIKGGFVYMAAIIDWYSKAVLSYRISNTMDVDLVVSVLSEALSLYGKQRYLIQTKEANTPPVFIQIPSNEMVSLYL